jgi:hypothetical protein
MDRSGHDLVDVFDIFGNRRLRLQPTHTRSNLGKGQGQLVGQFIGAPGIFANILPAMIGEDEFSTDFFINVRFNDCLLYTSPSPRDRTRSRMPSSA